MILVVPSVAVVVLVEMTLVAADIASTVSATRSDVVELPIALEEPCSRAVVATIHRNEMSA